LQVISTIYEHTHNTIASFYLLRRMSARVFEGETSCTRPGCYLDNEDNCVLNVCYGLTEGMCMDDCEWDGTM
jgi:hypothetical protein